MTRIVSGKVLSSDFDVSAVAVADGSVPFVVIAAMASLDLSKAKCDEIKAKEILEMQTSTYC
jgi:methylthioribose-1-phosphate isomerase